MKLKMTLNIFNKYFSRFWFYVTAVRDGAEVSNTEQVNNKFCREFHSHQMDFSSDLVIIFLTQRIYSQTKIFLSAVVISYG